MRQFICRFLHLMSLRSKCVLRAFKIIKGDGLSVAFLLLVKARKRASRMGSPQNVSVLWGVRVDVWRNYYSLPSSYLSRFLSSVSVLTGALIFLTAFFVGFLSLRTKNTMTTTMMTSPMTIVGIIHHR